MIKCRRCKVILDNEGLPGQHTDDGEHRKSCHQSIKEEQEERERVKKNLAQQAPLVRKKSQPKRIVPPPATKGSKEGKESPEDPLVGRSYLWTRLFLPKMEDIDFE